MSTKIAIVPDELRVAARTYGAAGTSLKESRARLGAPVPDMPTGLRARVQEVIDASLRDLTEQIGYIAAEATALERRAVWAEKADRGGWSWLLDMFDAFGLGGVPTLSDRFGQMSRPDLDKLLRDYQVASEGEAHWWEPRWPLSILTDPEKLTDKGGDLLDQLQVSRGALGLKAFKDIRDRARAESKARYNGKPGEEDGHWDAFRHAYWNAMLVRKFGDKFATKYTTAHETLPNPATREAMDLYNNERGRQVALDNPHADDKELADLIQQSIDRGDMVVIDANHKLTWSDRVPVGSTGQSDGTILDGGMPADGADSHDRNEGSES